jgi:hypothetical protein
MPIIITKTYKKFQLKSQAYEIWKGHKERRRKLVSTDKRCIEILDWMFTVLKNLGYYTNKSSIQKDDIIVGRLLGISGEMIKKYRTRIGHMPTERIIIRLKELEESYSKVKIRIIRNRKRDRKLSAKPNTNNIKCS